MIDPKKTLAGPDRPDDHDFSKRQLIIGALVMGFIMIAAVAGIILWLTT